MRTVYGQTVIVNNRAIQVKAGSTWPGGTADATTYTYDAPSGLLTRVQDAATNHTDYTYNDRGLVATRELSRLNASSQRIKTTYSYASNSTELIGKDYNDNTPDVSFTYNRLGQMLTATDVYDGSTTQTRTFEYNAYQQLAVEKLPSYLGSRWITYTYENGSGGTLEGRGSGYELGVSGDTDQDMKSLLGYSSASGLVTSLTATHAGVSARTFAYSYANNTSLVTGIAQSTIGYTQTRAYETDRDLLKEITTKFSTTTKTRFDYTFNSLGQKVSAKQYGQSGSAFADLGDDTFYRYTYNIRGELTLAAGYLGANAGTYSGSNALPGRYFELGYDQAGNRTSHNATGVSGLKSDYTVNNLNQITGREHHYVPVSGTVDADAQVVVNGELAGQQGNYWSGEAVLDNSSGPAYATDISVKAAKPSPETKQISGLLSAFIEPAAETLSYDDDGNLSSDGRWTYTYDAENRLVSMETNSTAMAVGLPGKRYIFRYDSLGRRTAKEEWNWSGSSWTLNKDLRFVYQGWNLIAELDGSGTRQRTHAWGLDIAGTMGGTGGIGALVQTVDHTGTATAYLPGYDGSGNVTALMQSDGTIAAAYEYSPFGRALRAQGAYAEANPFRFSTKYTDETGLVYYGHRYYSPSLGRFINRDPIGSAGGVNLYAFAGNNPANGGDYLGLDAFMLPLGDGAWFEGDGMTMEDFHNQSVAQANSVHTQLAAGMAYAAAIHWHIAKERARQGDYSWIAMYDPWGVRKGTVAALDKMKEVQRGLDEGETVKIMDSKANVYELGPGMYVKLGHNGISIVLIGALEYSVSSPIYGGSYEYDERKKDGKVKNLAGSSDAKLNALISLVSESENIQTLIRRIVDETIKNERRVKQPMLFWNKTVTQRQERHIYGYIPSSGVPVIINVATVKSEWYSEGESAGATFRTAGNMPVDAIPFVIHTHAWDAALSSADFKTTNFGDTGAYVIGIQAPSGTVMVLSPNEGTLYEGDLKDFGVR